MGMWISIGLNTNKTKIPRLKFFALAIMACCQSMLAQQSLREAIFIDYCCRKSVARARAC